MVEGKTPVPREEILGSGAGGPLAQPGPWIVNSGWIQYSGGLVVGAPTGGNKGAGTVNAQSFYINGTLIDLTKYVQLTGGTMTGMLTLAMDPVNIYDAVDKRYVDNAVTTINNTFANYLPITGGNISGNLAVAGTMNLSADPTSNLQAATKQYVDVKASGFTIPDAPSDGSTYGRNNGAWTNVYDAGTY
jgi:hypothetical protein